ncbi:hypothetical protein N7489_009463 [Penicillium chrysogenum]|uniref:uncharacterized protein n=1 Tax=Penicillium chrysogenum TaxID=5076 RepID=UPI002386AC49|nr:uncharacterized protein N7489_009463 [Penicillium chrysogenum]KAJ5228755.1 hypothetical protein N7489_009463 [Penicillium chrysogenum]KAJ5258157.1 hypothetical protein N7524_009713 [Penicillium chrysogenum]KAJ6168586.1 hypothetical protein N7497_001429 [Penicillium chrysogenum]
MLQQVAITCVMSDYEWMENPFYVPDLENRAAEQGWQEESLPPLDGTRATLEIDLEPTTNVVCSVVRPSETYDDYGFECIYDGGQPHPGQVERYVWLSPEMTRKIEEGYDGGAFVGDTDDLYAFSASEGETSV